jgi:hypothetical protein
MSTKKALKRIAPAILAGLVAAGTSAVWASPTDDAADEADTASLEPAGLGTGGSASSSTGSAPISRGPSAQVDFGAQLIGTAVVEGGPSIAFLQLATGTRFVREGDEIVAGVRLVKVWRNRIDVERAGTHLDIRPTSNPEPPSAGRMAASGDVDRLWETQGRTGRSLFYSHYRQSPN